MKRHRLGMTWTSRKGSMILNFSGLHWPTHDCNWGWNSPAARAQSSLATHGCNCEDSGNPMPHLQTPWIFIIKHAVSCSTATSAWIATIPLVFKQSRILTHTLSTKDAKSWICLRRRVFWMTSGHCLEAQKAQKRQEERSKRWTTSLTDGTDEMTLLQVNHLEIWCMFCIYIYIIEYYRRIRKYDITWCIWCVNDLIDPVCLVFLSSIVILCLQSNEVYGHGELVSKPPNRILSQTGLFLHRCLCLQPMPAHNMLFSYFCWFDCWSECSLHTVHGQDTSDIKYISAMSVQ